MLSVCCSAPPLSDWEKEGKKYFGICSACKRECEFTFDGDEEEDEEWVLN